MRTYTIVQRVVLNLTIQVEAWDKDAAENKAEALAENTLQAIELDENEGISALTITENETVQSN